MCYWYRPLSVSRFHREENFSLFLDAKEQVLDYLSQKRKSFNLPLKIPELSSFEGAVYKELIKVPYGETLSYQELAMFSGHEKAFRAVGSTLAKNDLCLLIPCHRILRKNGELGGYRAGTSIKQKLLDIEQSSSFCPN